MSICTVCKDYGKRTGGYGVSKGRCDRRRRKCEKQQMSEWQKTAQPNMFLQATSDRFCHRRVTA